MTRPQVVIIGAGFGGLAAAQRLADEPVDVTMVDQNNFHTFQPFLYQVATSGLAPSDVAYPVRGIVSRQDNLEFRQATVISTDLEARRLHLQGEDHEVGDLGFDHLVVAAGAVTNTFGIPGVEHHGFPLYHLDDAVCLRNHILERFEAADVDPSLVDDGALTVMVVGGGPTGVETAGALAELFQNVLDADYQTLDVGRARVILVEMNSALLGSFSGVSQRHARETLEERGVEVRTDTSVSRVRATAVELEKADTVAAHTLVWAAGVKANPLAEALGLPTTSSGRISVDEHLAVVGHPGVWAIGDVAAIGASPSVDATALPQLAPVAMQSGRHVAAQIGRSVRLEDLEAFHYRDKGTMATIGRSRAVAELPLGIKLRGFPAWLAWLGLHLVFLAGFRNRISVFVNWAWNWLTWDRGPRINFRARR